MPFPSAFAVLDARDGRVLDARSPDTRALPGSTVKPFLPDVGVFPCKGRLTLDGRRIDCTHLPVAGPLDYSQAVALSCNWYFTTLALRLDPGDLRTALRDFEARLPTTDLDRQLQAVGLWGVSTTPLRLARAYRGLMLRDPSRVSNGGKTGTTAEAAWYAGWAPVENPRIVVAAMTGGRGATDARPAAGELIRKWLR